MLENTSSGLAGCNGPRFLTLYWTSRRTHVIMGLLPLLIFLLVSNGTYWKSTYIRRIRNRGIEERMICPSSFFHASLFITSFTSLIPEKYIIIFEHQQYTVGLVYSNSKYCSWNYSESRYILMLVDTCNSATSIPVIATWKSTVRA